MAEDKFYLSERYIKFRSRNMKIATLFFVVLLVGFAVMSVSIQNYWILIVIFALSVVVWKQYQSIGKWISNAKFECVSIANERITLSLEAAEIVHELKGFDRILFQKKQDAIESIVLRHKKGFFLKLIGYDRTDEIARLLESYADKNIIRTRKWFHK